MKTKKTVTKRRQTRHKPVAATVHKRAPFMVHLLELRRRVTICAISIIAWSGIAYAFENQIIRWLLKPANGEKFIYTSPGGGIDFLIRVCLYFGLVMSAPVIIYQILRYVEPLIGKSSTRFILFGTFATGVLALGGMAFGYYFGLPTALKFLTNQFSISDITALITIQSYLSFVIAYLAGSALIFQVPLWMYFINRVRPIKVRTLMKNQRWVILVSFIVAALINPSPRPQDLFLLALPMIVSYEIGALIIWRLNYVSKHQRHIHVLTEADRQLQVERQNQFMAAREARQAVRIDSA